MLDPLTWFSANVGTPLPDAAWVTAMEEAAVFVASATEVAVTITVGTLGKLAGAVYVTVKAVSLVKLPQEVPEQPAPDKLQVTPSF